MKTPEEEMASFDTRPPRELAGERFDFRADLNGESAGFKRVHRGPESWGYDMERALKYGIAPPEIAALAKESGDA